jgi:hypothetical protein
MLDNLIEHVIIVKFLKGLLGLNVLQRKLYFIAWLIT